MRRGRGRSACSGDDWSDRDRMSCTWQAAGIVDKNLTVVSLTALVEPLSVMRVDGRREVDERMTLGPSAVGAERGGAGGGAGGGVVAARSGAVALVCLAVGDPAGVTLSDQLFLTFFVRASNVGLVGGDLGALVDNPLPGYNLSVGDDLHCGDTGGDANLFHPMLDLFFSRSVQLDGRIPILRVGTASENRVTGGLRGCVGPGLGEIMEQMLVPLGLVISFLMETEVFEGQLVLDLGGSGGLAILAVRGRALRLGSWDLVLPVLVHLD